MVSALMLYVVVAFVARIVDNVERNIRRGLLIHEIDREFPIFFNW